jgi:hypothetical protein
MASDGLVDVAVARLTKTAHALPADMTPARLVLLQAAWWICTAPRDQSWVVALAVCGMIPYPPGERATMSETLPDTDPACPACCRDSRFDEVDQ